MLLCVASFTSATWYVQIVVTQRVHMSTKHCPCYICCGPQYLHATALTAAAAAVSSATTCATITSAAVDAVRARFTSTASASVTTTTAATSRTVATAAAIMLMLSSTATRLIALKRTEVFCQIIQPRLLQIANIASLHQQLARSVAALVITEQVLSSISSTEALRQLLR
jgi:hypothetical protein